MEATFFLDVRVFSWKVNSVSFCLDEHKISAVENPALETVEETSRDQWYDDMDNLSDPPDAGEIDDNSSSSDFEDTYIKKKKKKKKVSLSGVPVSDWTLSHRTGNHKSSGSFLFASFTA